MGVYYKCAMRLLQYVVWSPTPDEVKTRHANPGQHADRAGLGRWSLRGSIKDTKGCEGGMEWSLRRVDIPERHSQCLSHA
jgi:hypothetical protein